MLGIDYGSDSDDERSDQSLPSASASKSSLISQLPKASNKPKVDLPTPASSSRSSNATPSSSVGLSLPATKSKKATGPKKILLELPKLEKQDDDDELEPERPVAKKPRLGGGPGSSSLLSMLPAPKKSGPGMLPPERVLGGGRPGVVFSSTSNPSRPMVVPGVEKEEGAADRPDADLMENTSTYMLPPSLAKSKAKANVPPTEATTVPSASTPSVDFFSLGSTLTSRVSSAPPVPSTPNSSISVSAAPNVEEYRPPSPTPQDPYPGYYMLPSGQWAMHDTEYYNGHATRWAKEYDAEIRKYERGLGGAQKGFEGANEDGAVDVNADEQRDAARKEREEKKALTRDTAREHEPKVPNMKINPQKLGGLARTRHQLSSLLTDAYMNREALEDQIAQGRRNRKEAGNKYGF